jgi:hypothetical protein
MGAASKGNSVLADVQSFHWISTVMLHCPWLRGGRAFEPPQMAPGLNGLARANDAICAPLFDALKLTLSIDSFKLDLGIFHH